MPRTSAGLLLYRLRRGGPEVLLVHPGGPYWKGKEHGVWSIPKGEPLPGEELESAALREFEEETGFRVAGPLTPLGQVRQRGGKRVHAWCTAGDVDPAALRSNCFEIEWPPRSGQMRSFPEVDRAAWFTLPEARRRIVPAQAGLLDALEEWLRSSEHGARG